MGALPNLNFDLHSFPIPCNNLLNQFQEEINDWANKTKWVVDNFMGSPIDIWLKGLNNFPPYSL